jgi:hypothetical protein
MEYAYCDGVLFAGRPRGMPARPRHPASPAPRRDAAQPAGVAASPLPQSVWEPEVFTLTSTLRTVLKRTCRFHGPHHDEQLRELLERAIADCRGIVAAHPSPTVPEKSRPAVPRTKTGRASWCWQRRPARAAGDWGAVIPFVGVNGQVVVPAGGQLKVPTLGGC